MTENIFLQISALLGITVTVALVMRLLRQPLMVAYLVAGMVAGPLFLNLLQGEEHFFEAFAQFGIVLLLFLVGLSLNVNYIRQVGKSVFTAAIIQFSITVVLGWVFMSLVGLEFSSALFLSVATAFSSTIIVSKLLGDKKDTEALYGKFTIGVLLVQDIIAIGIMIFLNTVRVDGGSIAVTLFTVLSKGLVLAGVVFILARFILPHIVNRVAHSSELLFIFTIAWCFGIASFVYAAGFNIEIGAIIAGISLGASPYQSIISSRIRPLRDFFIVLFFIMLGSEMQLAEARGAILPALILAAFVLVVDPLILFFIMRRLKYTRRNAFLAAVTAAQVSEFGFILLFKAEEFGYVDGKILAILTIAALTTIVVSSYLISYNEELYRVVRPFFDLFGPDKVQQKNPVRENYDALVFGYHRIGWRVCEALRERGLRFAVVDFNPDVVDKLRLAQIPAYFGDAADVEFLETLSLENAKYIISTLPEVDDQKTLVRYVRHVGSKAYVLANLYHTSELHELYSAGADFVMIPHLLGGQWMAEVIEDRPWNKATFRKLREEQMREIMMRRRVGIHLS